MPAAAFASGQAVATSAVAVNRTTMANARVLPRAMVTPTQTSLVAGRDRAAAPPSALADRAVMAAHTPPPATPSFAQRQSALQKNAGQPLSVNQMRTLAAQAHGRSANAPAASNVRVVGDRGSAAASTAAQSPGNAAQAANNGNARAAQQTPNGRNIDRPVVNSNGTEARVRSADFAHQGAQNNAAPNNKETVRGNAVAHGTNRRVPETGPSMTQQSESASRSRGNSSAPQSNRSTAATASSRGSEQRIRTDQQVSTRSPARQSAPVNRQPSYSLREPRGAPARQQGSAPSMAQHGPAQQHSMPAQRSAPQPQRAPPPQMAQQHASQQRAPGPPRQQAVARQGPQNAPHGGNQKKKDGGGG